MNYKDKSCLVCDVGIGIEHAARLAKDFGRIYYYAPYLSDDGTPDFEPYSLGSGFDNITKVNNYYDVIEKADLIVFPYIGYGRMADYWRKQGKRVFGAGQAEELEQDRIYMRHVQKEIGLPVQKTYFPVGTDRLKKFLLEEHPKEKFFIKINRIRGLQETFSSQDADNVIRSLEYHLGPFKNDFKFMVEEELDDDTSVESGFDGFFNGIKFLEPSCFGYEVKASYIAKFDKLPDILRTTREKIAVKLRQLGYRGAMSNEVFIGKDKKPYWIDATLRFGYPLSLCYTEIIANYSDVIWNVAEGKDIRVELNAKYFGIVPLTSTYSLQNWLKINMDEKDKSSIKLEYAAKKDGVYYGVRDYFDIIHIIAIGNSVADVVKKLKDNLSKVSAQELQTQAIGSLDKIEKECKQGQQYGISL